MIPTDNSNEMLSVYADWLEDQDINTVELRNDIDSVEINQWFFEYKDDFSYHPVGSFVDSGYIKSSINIHFNRVGCNSKVGGYGGHVGANSSGR